MLGDAIGATTLPTWVSPAMRWAPCASISLRALPLAARFSGLRCRKGRGGGDQNGDIKPAFLQEKRIPSRKRLAGSGWVLVYWTGPEMEHCTWARARVRVGQKAGFQQAHLQFHSPACLFFCFIFRNWTLAGTSTPRTKCCKNILSEHAVGAMIQ